MKVAIELDISHFKRFMKVQEERQKAMAEVSSLLGVDFRMSDEEKLRYAEEEFTKYLENEVYKGVEAWMKSAFS
tara:strand:- start:188 stop:409 length:222 start_codon:yes stop_codon:yes gene_type:complete